LLCWAYCCCIFRFAAPSLPLAVATCACRLLREYIELEFNATLAHKLSFPMDVERVVDDIVLFCMLVGNDFLPGG
jgi:hypothetical protein